MKHSRLIAFVLVAAMLLSWAVVPESQVHAHETEPTITVGSVEGKPGDTLQIPVTMTNNPGITILNTRVQFDDEAIEVVNSSNNADGPLGACSFVKSQKDGTNPVTMYWEDGLEDHTGDGIIGYIEVTIKADAKPGTYDVVMLDNTVEAFNISFDEIKFDLVDGVITVLCAEHDFEAYTSDNNATCTADGTKSRVCKACGEKETVTDIGSALGHSFTEYVSDNNATCETDGTETATCGRCGVTDTRTAEGSALGHSFTEYVSDNNATCETDGTETATCDRCDATDTRTDVGSKADADHSFPAEYTSDGNATCTADGTKSRVCSVCGEKETVTDVGSALGHSFTEYVSDNNATCEADGTETATCDRCDATDTRTDAGSALGHDYTAKTTAYQAAAADCCHKAAYYYTCANCGKQGTETFEYGEVDLTKHVGGTEVRGQKPATEEEEGYTGDTYCLGCGNVVAKGESIPVLGHTHDMVKTNAKEATCEAEGNTAYWTCAKCGKLYADAEGAKEITAEDTVIAALGHSFTNYVSDNNATCTADGTETAKCDRCDATDTRTDAGSKLGHSFTNYVSDGNATCTADGTETAKCDRCDVTDTRTDAGSALGHSFTNYVSDGNATCEADGTETATCDRCDVTDTRTDVGSALGHDYTAKTTAYQATEADCCHKATYYYTCANCGKQGTETFEYGEVDLTKHVGGTEVRGAVAPTEETEGYTGDTYCLGCETVIAKGETIPTLDHTHDLVKTDAKEATCETAGNATYWTCAKCGKLFADAEGTKEITAEDTVIAALGHSFTNYVSDGNATCTADGTETAKCDRCDATDTRTAEGSAKGHNWSAWEVTTEATCTEAGEETRTCGNCGETETNVLEAPGHAFGEWTVVKEAACTEAGEEIRACGNCGETETNVLEALGHSFTNYVSDDNATCTADGTETAKCDRCDATDTRTAEGSAKGHNWSAWEVTTEATCMEAGEEIHTCGNCGETETNVLEALGHSFTNYVSNGNATCTADGTETAKCDRCDATDTRTAEGSAKGHNWSAWEVTTEATCTEAGEEIRTCGNCGETETNVLEAMGHAFGEWTVVKEAACTEAGEETRACAACAVTESREIPALGHAYDSVVTEPTEDKKGYTTHTCANCGDSYVDNYVDPKPGTTDEPELDNQPQTGDDSQTILWISLMLASILGTGAVLVSRKKWLA